MRLQLLIPRFRVLFLIYHHPNISESELKSNLFPSEYSAFATLLQSLLIEKSILQLPNSAYQINPNNNNTFIKTLYFFYTTSNLVSKIDIRNNIKNKTLNYILEQLIHANILSEYRSELSKKIYLCLSDQYQTCISKLNQSFYDQSKSKEQTSLHDQSFCIMLDHNQSILSSSSDQFEWSDFNDSEIKVIVNLYHDIDVKHRKKTGRDEQYIIHNLFDNQTDLAKQTIIRLVNKQIVKCSFNQYYFLNNATFAHAKSLLHQHQDLIVEYDEMTN